MSAICLTAGERAENHVWMQKVGSVDSAENGFSIQDLEDFLEKFKSLDKNLRYDFIRLDSILSFTKSEKELYPELSNIKIEPAGLLIIRNGVDILLENNNDKLFKQTKDAKKEFSCFPNCRHGYDCVGTCAVRGYAYG